MWTTKQAKKTMLSKRGYIEVGYYNIPKTHNMIPGDVFLSRKIREEDRLVSVLSDGLGSGVKANVLASLTATMALNYTASHSMNVVRSAETIMDTLPICSVRKISYSTFTIVDIDTTGRTRIIEHGNPSFVVLRPDGEVPIQRTRERLEKWEDRVITHTTFKASVEDRIVFFSDGVSQAGTGDPETPFGWGEENVADFARVRVKKYPRLSASELAKNIMDKALKYDGAAAKDDITCAVIYFREPRRLLVVTGPPYAADSDHELAEAVRNFDGEKVICGGTTASIIGRELDLNVALDLDDDIDPNVPPPSSMEGIDLVTEGTLTLAEVARILESDLPIAGFRRNAARALAEMLFETDIVEFVVGTRVNEAHQDPNIPVELDLRRNIVRRIATQLDRKYLKETSVRYM
jgi:hypothetical protein